METKIPRERLITFLLETPMFERLSPGELMEIVPIVDVVPYRAGEVVFSEGDAGDAWYVIYKGAVDVLRQGRSGEVAINRLGPRTCFGEIAILDGSPRSASIRTSEDSVMFRIPREAFDSLIEAEHLVAYKLIHQMAILLASRQRGSTARLSELLYCSGIGEIQEGIQLIVGEASVRE